MADNVTCTVTLSVIDAGGAVARVILHLPAASFASAASWADQWATIFSAVTNCAVTKSLITLKRVRDGLTAAGATSINRAAILLFENDQGDLWSIPVPGVAWQPDANGLQSPGLTALAALMVGQVASNWVDGAAPWGGQAQEYEAGRPLAVFVGAYAGYEENRIK